MYTLIPTTTVIYTQSGATYILGPKRRITGGSLMIRDGILNDCHIAVGKRMVITNLEDGHHIITTPIERIIP